METFTCDYCGRDNPLAAHVMVPCPHMGDEHSICRACIIRYGSAAFRQQLATEGDPSGAHTKVALDEDPGDWLANGSPAITQGRQLKMET